LLRRRADSAQPRRSSTYARVEGMAVTLRSPRRAADLSRVRCNERLSLRATGLAAGGSAASIAAGFSSSVALTRAVGDLLPRRPQGIPGRMRLLRVAPAENLLPAAWRRVSLAARIPAVAARDWWRLAEQEGGTQMRTITSFLLPARTSCTRSFRHVQLSVPPRQATV